MVRRPNIPNLLWYFVAPLIASIAPMMTIPAVTSTYGSDGWYAIAVGMSVGAIASVAIELGWGITGPLLIARSSGPDAARIYADCFMQRALITIIAAPIAGFVAGQIAAVETTTSSISALASAGVGLSGAWFWIGRQKPLMMVIFDSLPRVVASGLGAVSLLAGAPLVTLPAAQLAACIVVSALPLALAGPRGPKRHNGVMDHFREIGTSQAPAAIARACTSVYVNLPVAIIAALGTVAVATEYSVADRLEKLALLALMPISQVWQGWIPRGETARERTRRLKTATSAACIVGVVAAAGFVLAAPAVSWLLFRDVGTPSVELRAIFGVVVFCVLVTRCTGAIGLPMLGRTWSLTFSVLGGAVAGLPFIVWFALQDDAVGVAASLAASEMVVLVWQIRLLDRANVKLFRRESIQSAQRDDVRKEFEADRGKIK